MFDEVFSLVSQGWRVVQLARDAGLESPWQALLFAGASCAAWEVLKRAACKGLGLCHAAVMWLATPAPLTADEQAILDAVESGFWCEDSGVAASLDGTIAASHRRDGDVCIDGEAVNAALSARALARIRAAALAKYRDHQDAEAALRRESAQWKISKLQRKRSV